MSIEVARNRTSLTERLAVEIKVAMVRHGITGRQLAQALGTSQTWISTRLTGATPIDVNDLEGIADALDVSPADLIAAAAQAKPLAVRPTQRILRAVGREPISELSSTAVGVSSGDEPPTRGRRRKGVGSYDCPTRHSANQATAATLADITTRRPVRSRLHATG